MSDEQEPPFPEAAGAAFELRFKNLTRSRKRNLRDRITDKILNDMRNGQDPPTLAREEEIQRETVASAESLLARLGMDLRHADLLATPRRYVKAMREMTRGYHEDPRAILSTRFDADGFDQMILLRDVPFASLCEHHCLPFTGRAHVAYLPGPRVVGLSKLARVVDVFARRFQIQERMTKQIADAIENALDPVGVAVMIEASHSCMVVRGVAKPGATMSTSDLRGAFRSNPSARAEFFSLVRPE
jgi:GTP cyclohydrolase I